MQKYWEESKATFLVALLQIHEEVLTSYEVEELYKALQENATHVGEREVYLFEGDWDLVLPHTKAISHVQDLEVPSLGGLSDKELTWVVDNLT